MCCSCAHCTPGAVFRAAQCSGIRGAAFVLQSRGSSPSSRTGDGICVGGARSLRMMRKALFEMVTPWGKGIEKMDLWVEQEWDGTLSSVINGSINKAWSRGTLQIYGFLSPPADAIMADRTECLSRGNWAGIMKKGKKKKKKQAESGVHFYPLVRTGWWVWIELGLHSVRVLPAPVIYNKVGEGHLASLLAQEEPIIFTESIFALLKIRDNKMNR